MKCVLFSRPNHDDTVAYLHYYSKQLIDLAKSKRLKIINKEGKNANKKIILNVIKKQKPNLIMFNGHGSPEFICGHANEVIVSSGENPDVLFDTVTYALACSSADKLGRKVCEKGALAFIGYMYDFAIGRDPDSEATPSKDKIAKYFLEPSNILFSSLIKGKKVGESVLKAKEKMRDNIGFLETTDKFPEASFYAPFLYGNYIGLTIHGDKSVSI